MGVFVLVLVPVIDGVSVLVLVGLFVAPIDFVGVLVSVLVGLTDGVFERVLIQGRVGDGVVLLIHRRGPLSPLLYALSRSVRSS